jgi:O-antigen ligase
MRQYSPIAAHGYDYLAVLFFIFFGIFVFKGPIYFLLGILSAVSIIAIWKPKIVPLAVFFLSPLVAGKGEVVFGILSPAALLALWFIILGGIIYIRILLQTDLRVHKLAIYLFFLMLIALASIVLSNNKVGTIEETLRLLSVALMLLLSIFMSSQQQYRITVIKTMLLSSMTPLVVGLYQKLSGNLQAGGARLTQYEIQTGIMRLYSTFYDAQPFAKYLLVVLVILFALLLQGVVSPKTKPIAAIFFILALWELNLTYARGPLIGFAVAMLFILYSSKKLTLSQIALLVGVFGAILYATGNINRFIELFDPGAAAGPNSVELRISLWENALGEILQNPILGHGAASFDDAFGLIAHNDYLGLWYELGIAGLLLYILMLVHAGLFALTCSCRLAGVEKAVALAVLGLTVAIAIGSVAENYFGSNTLWWYFVGLLACLIGAYRSHTRPDREMP